MTIPRSHGRMVDELYGGLKDAGVKRVREAGPYDGLYRINPFNACKTAGKGQEFMKDGGVNACFGRILPIKTNGYSKKWAFDHSAGVPAVRAKVSI